MFISIVFICRLGWPVLRKAIFGITGAGALVIIRRIIAFCVSVFLIYYIRCAVVGKTTGGVAAFANGVIAPAVLFGSVQYPDNDTRSQKQCKGKQYHVKGVVG